MRISSPNPSSSSPLRDHPIRHNPAAGEDADAVASVDFSDVFGGPPRRRSSLLQEIHHQRSTSSGGNYCSHNRPHIVATVEDEEDRGEYHDDDDDDDDDADEAVSSSSYPWRRKGSGLSGKAVFGDEVTSRRRHRVSEDFFDDVFGGDQSSVGSPRMVPRDPFAVGSSSPGGGGSRVLSPARPARPSGGLIGGSFTQFSLPARLANTDLLAAASGKCSPYGTRDGVVENCHPYPSSTPMPRLSSRSIHNNDLLAVDAFSISHRSPLSRESSFCIQETAYLKDGGVEVESIFNQDAIRSEILDDSTQFHFSMHKWASHGVPLVMFLRRRTRRRRSGYKSNEKNTTWSSSSPSDGVDNGLLEGEIDTLKDALRSNVVELSTAPCARQEEKGDASVFNGNADEIIDTCRVVGEEVPAVVQPLTLASLLSVDIEDPQEVTQNCLEVVEEEEMPSHESNKSAYEEEERRVSDRGVNAEKYDPVSVGIMKSDSADEKDYIASYTVVEAQVEEINVQSKDEKPVDVTGVSSCEEGEDFVLQQGAKGSGGNERKTRVAGKVKEFVKIFNQEAGTKPTANADANIRSCRLREKSVLKAEHHEKSRPPTKQDDIQTPEVSRTKTSETSKPSVRQQADARNAHKVSEISASQNDYAAETNGLIPEVYEDSVLDIDLEEIMMLPEEIEKPPAVSEDQEETEVSESKIIRWSKGKEGNIRALLSTLQYVLWPNSGWKPVALVDIIEANAVKRSYQKAMLCLHPDKLQQRGADANLKLIAEKLLDILQAAWDHFNTLGSL